MRQAGVNLVTVGVFAWSRLEPEPGRYDFGWLDRVLDLLHDGGIRVALATPTASPPPWFSLAHPDALPVTADGVRLSHGSRDTYCASAPAYRAAARRIATALAERYRDHPALAHVARAQRVRHRLPLRSLRRAPSARWLRERYGDLDALNDAWTTSFWSQHYTDWAQIRTPRATQYLPNPAQVLDFRRFCSDSLLAAYVEQRDLLRSATPGVPVTTNYVLGGWVPVDHARWSTEVDLVAIDHYPSSAGPRGRGADRLRRRPGPGLGPAGGVRRRSRADEPLGGPAWLLMESAPNLILTPGRMHAKEPGRMTRHSLAHVARGSRGAMFFQWRAPRGGAELFHSAMVPHAGPDTRVFREVVAFGAALRRVAEVRRGPRRGAGGDRLGRRQRVGVAEPGLPSAYVDYHDEVAAAHRALWRAGYATDVVGLDEPPGGLPAARAARPLSVLRGGGLPGTGLRRGRRPPGGELPQRGRRRVRPGARRRLSGRVARPAGRTGGGVPPAGRGRQRAAGLGRDGGGPGRRRRRW